MGSIPTAKKNRKLMNKTNNSAAASTITLLHDEVLSRFSKKICTLSLSALRKVQAL
jgi:hypothetical protein